MTKFGINSDLLQKSKEYNINLFSTLEEIIKEKVRDEKIKSWQEENKESIESYNARIERDGVFGKEYRCF